MLRLFLPLSFFFLLKIITAQTPLTILGDSGPMEQITIISGIPLQLTTNFEAIRGIDVPFSDNHRTSSMDTPYPIGFPFRFYQTDYSEFFVGANGYITFDNPPRNPATVLIAIPFATPDPQYPRNSIFGAFKGWDVSSGNYVTRLLTGQSPDIMQVITWCDVPALQSEATGTVQIVLHENGLIDLHLIRIPESNYAGNNTASGIQSADPFTGLAVPGRNLGSWPPAATESWRFEWRDSFYEVSSISHSPVPVAEHIDWYELSATGERRWIADTRQIVVSPKLSTRYLAEVSTCWGEVIDFAILNVSVEGVFPNAFNPQSAIINNQTFKMPTIPGAVVSNYRLQIYNRWGQLVFETTDVNEGWNGRMNNTGQEAPMGVYHWIVMVEQNGKTPITNSGAVMLVR